ncbi:hypothetical protein L226DRAFT_540668 [Lentinus tigrinus ALCF2SS1-7]|uniref:uncharacterized protein n=1 Tax=Lentinus tigrinus ALCF2SS1-7 TaxID=1328758 RepID=UPI00116609A1|nr:hypothetical protein L226DRAFT_540668 [Lentinus tigrinus ALCF2SS1-7]
MFGASQYLDNAAEYCSNHECVSKLLRLLMRRIAGYTLQIVEAAKRYIKMVKNTVDALEDVFDRQSGSAG